MNKKLVRKRLSIKLYIKWYDFWVGFYYDQRMRALYVCLLPMLVVRLAFETEETCYCSACNVAMKKIAVLDEGWMLYWECPECADIADYPWPYGEELISSRQLEDAGFEIV
jgi:hypothetical protein